MKYILVTGMYLYILDVYTKFLIICLVILSDKDSCSFLFTFCLITGGVISGIGKGVVASSLGVILKQVK